MKANIKRSWGGGSRSGGGEIAWCLLSTVHTETSHWISARILVRAALVPAVHTVNPAVVESGSHTSWGVQCLQSSWEKPQLQSSCSFFVCTGWIYYSRDPHGFPFTLTSFSSLPGELICCLAAWLLPGKHKYLKSSFPVTTGTHQGRDFLWLCVLGHFIPM